MTQTMIVICPRCSTPYAIPPEAIGQQGRPVHCSACGHEWHQNLPAPSGEAADPSPPPPLASQGTNNAPLADSSAPAPATPPVEPPPAEEPESPSILESPRAEPVDVDPGNDSPAPQGNPATTTDDDTIAFADDEPIEAGDERVAAEELPQEATPPEPASAEPKPSPRRHWLVGGVAAGVTLLLLAGGVVAFQKTLVSAIPGTEAIFAIFEAPPPPPGAGLEIRDVSPRRELRGIHEIVVVSGSVANLTDETRPVPPLRVSLVDAEDAVLETTVIAPVATEVAGGENIKFEATLRDPGDQARNLRITFATPEG